MTLRLGHGFTCGTQNTSLGDRHPEVSMSFCGVGGLPGDLVFNIERAKIVMRAQMIQEHGACVLRTSLIKVKPVPKETCQPRTQEILAWLV